jgi:hypothetical protein
LQDNHCWKCFDRNNTEFKHICMREPLKKGHLQLRIKFNTVLPMSIILLFNSQASYL